MIVSTSPAPVRRNAAASSYSFEVKQATPCSNVGKTAAAGQNLAAIFGDDRRHAIRVFLVLGGIVDLGTRDPIGWHKFPFRFFVMPAHTRLQNGVASFAYGGHPCLLIDSLETKVVDGRNK